MKSKVLNEIFDGTIKKKRRHGKGVLTVNQREYFVEYNEKGKEIGVRKRTFEGIRIMIGFSYFFNFIFYLFNFF